MRMISLKIKKSNSILAAFALLSIGLSANAQEATTPAQPDPVVEQSEADLTILKKIKISGLVQMDYQVADTAGISTKAGGDFSSGINNRFQLRRGRIKAAYDNENTQGVLQIDMTEKGVGLKDAYLKFTEPWLQTVSVQGGVFDRPFGNEVEYSSSALETPERSRVIQTLFPGEKDLGAKLILQAPKGSVWNFIKLDAGFFNGNSQTSTSSYAETDKYKDFIGHLFLGKATKSEAIKWGIGASYYKGGFAEYYNATTASTNEYSMTKDANGNPAYVKTTVGKGDQAKREYFGFDGQLSFDWWLGITQLRGEYLWGTQPATSSSSNSLTGAASADTYIRKFNGYYGYFIQNIFQTPVQLVVKYDVYDPNTDVDGDNIGKATSTGFIKTGSGDVKYTTWGFGINYRWSSNVTLMAHYDLVKNETTSNIKDPSTLKDLSKDRKDNVFTLRLQYAF